MSLDCVTDIKLWPNKDNETFVAGGSITFSDAVSVKFRLLKKRDGTGYYLALPSTKNPKFDETKPIGDTNKKYYDEVVCKNSTIYQSLLAMVTDKFTEETKGTTIKKTAAKKSTGAITEGDIPPF